MKEFIQNLSAFLPLLPVTLALINYRSVKGAPLVLGLFLICGFFVDMKKYLFDDPAIYITFYLVYALLESLFYLWFLKKYFIHPKQKRGFELWYVIVAILWLIASTIFISAQSWPILFAGKTLAVASYFRFFDFICSILIVTLCSSEMLRLTRQEKPLERLPEFWILTGIFIYFFTTAFLFLFLWTTLESEVWYFHSYINVMVLLLYSFAIFMASRREPDLSYK